jgi:predicted transcriptional regulator
MMIKELTTEEKLYNFLHKKYKKILISKQEMADELGVSKTTMDSYVSKNEGIPPYKKLGTAKNAKVVFNIVDVAKFLNNTIATAN